MGLFAPVHDYIDALVHPAAWDDAFTAARHRAFIAARLLGSIILLAAIPPYLLVRGAPQAAELVLVGWLLASIFAAYFLSRTGRYESAHILSSATLTGLVTVIALRSGGVGSFAAIWLVLVPFDAALSASRRVVALASMFAVAAAGLLVLVGAPGSSGAVNTLGHPSLAALGIVSAALCAAGLALGAQSLASAGLLRLNADENRYRLLAHNMTDVITRHGRDGALLFASPAAQSLFGCRVEELSGHGLFERVHVADRPAYLTALGDAAALGVSRSVEFRVRRECSDGKGGTATEFVWVEMRCQPLEPSRAAAKGAVAGRGCEAVAVSRDVTERKRQEQALEKARTQAERADAAKIRFLATMSHELRTPLNAIIGFSDMLMNETSLMLDGKRRHDYAALIKESGEHLLAVVNGILDLSKIETDNFAILPEPFAPAGVMSRCCELLQPSACAAGVALERTATGDLPDMVADKRALSQILLNLISNAIRFTDRGGRVAIGARAEAAGVTFVVEDNGVGMSETDLSRVGEPYFQAHASYDRRRGGTGLGLSIVKGLVRLHGGEVDIHSRLGEGTRVSIRLPLDCARGRGAIVRAVPDFADQGHCVPIGAAANVTARRVLPATTRAALSNDTRVKQSA